MDDFIPPCSFVRSLRFSFSTMDFIDERELAELQTREEANLLEAYRRLETPKKELLLIYLKMLAQYSEELPENF